MKIQFGSEREFITGSAGSPVAANGRGPSVLRDSIFGRPVMLEIFDRVSLKLSPGSAIVTSQNLSHSQAMANLTMRGATQ